MPPLFMKAVSLALDDGTGKKQFECDVHAATIEWEDGDVVTYVTLCPSGNYSNAAADVASLHLVGVQRWTDGSGGPPTESIGLARYLETAAAAAKSLTFTFNAHGTGTPSPQAPAMTGTCVAKHPTYGGERDTWAEFDVTLPINGAPAIATTAAMAAELMAAATAELVEAQAAADAAAEAEAAA